MAAGLPFRRRSWLLHAGGGFLTRIQQHRAGVSSPGGIEDGYSGGFHIYSFDGLPLHRPQPHSQSNGVSRRSHYKLMLSYVYDSLALVS